MDDAALNFLQRLLDTPSPSGFEQPIQNHVRQYLADFADEIRTDLHGNVIAVKNPDAKVRVMFAGHCDQIGMLVQYIDAEGFLYAQTIGGWDPQVLIGQPMTVWTATGPVPAIIARKPIHLLSDEERKQVPKLKDLWIDIGAKDRDDVLSVVRIGDPITLEMKYQTLRNNCACSPAMDDKCGLWVVLEAFRRARCAARLRAVRRLDRAGRDRPARRHDQCLQHRSAGRHRRRRHARHRLPHDRQETGRGRQSRRRPGDLSRAEHEPRGHRAAGASGRDGQLAHQLAASGRGTGTDANAIQVSRGGVATGLVSIPNRYMHSPVEMISLADIDTAADLLAAFANSIKRDDDFRP